ncbi:hypothetical protein BgAZ_205990 [Babesia gibsoni]|uniref:Uncharacterized protein n=1 Tax=Babesia gibsoni TaxID=33632 RepID=A0AAD8LQA7_BABGI|nr:hypothetical protein BgAZ_205990 [Babesia gibsoni]
MLNIKVEHVDQANSNDDFRAFSGVVQDSSNIKNGRSLESWKGKHVIGIAKDANIKEHVVIQNHPVARLMLLPEMPAIQVKSIVSNLIPLCRALICEHLHLRTVENDVVVLLSESMEPAVPYLQWLLMKNARVLLFLPATESQNEESETVDDLYKHDLFDHGRFKGLATNVIIKRSMVEGISQHTLKLTKGMGASAIAILPGAEVAFCAEEEQLCRQLLLAAGMGCRIVWQTSLQQMDPCECRCLFSKAITLGFFNFNTMLEAHSSDGHIQHGLLEIVNRAADNEVFTRK